MLHKIVLFVQVIITMFFMETMRRKEMRIKLTIPMSSLYTHSGQQLHSGAVGAGWEWDGLCVSVESDTCKANSVNDINCLI